MEPLGDEIVGEPQDLVGEEGIGRGRGAGHCTGFSVEPPRDLGAARARAPP